ncbi:MAG: metallophosphoesterase family protein [Bacteroidia bacterium]|nr:metallophosphoesterase family protein [Bacteroidia bacterium]
MRKILLLSDTHGCLDEAMLRYINPADEIWHAGDIGSADIVSRLGGMKPLKAVFGNIDGAGVRALCPLNQRFRCEGKNVLMTHIGGYPPRYNPAVLEMLKQEKPDIFICGHSHILKIIYDKNLGILHLNPGAAGTYGFHKVRTMLRFTIEGENIKDMEIIELGKRTAGI